MKFLGGILLVGLLPMVSSLGQQQIISFQSDGDDTFQLAGGDVSSGQILVDKDEYWGVIRAAGDLTVDFGRVTNNNLSLSNGETDADPALFKYKPVDVSNNTIYETTEEKSFKGPEYTDPDASNTLIIVGTIGRSKIIDDLIKDDKIDVSDIEGEWEAFVTKVVESPFDGCDEALVIAGSTPRGTIYGIYDISEQIGVSPWYFWADVPVKTNDNIFVSREQKTQGPPTVDFRGIFLNDEQPGLTSWVAENFGENEWNDSVGYNHKFYSMVCELILRLRANYLWPTVWGSIVYTDDPSNQPLIYAYEVVLGSSHTEPMMRAQNEFGKFYGSAWAYNENNETIDEYFRVGVERAKPYVRNSLWTMAMRGTGDTAIEGLGIEVIVEMLETLVHNQQDILKEGLGVDDLSEVPMLWCLYKEVQGYKDEGLEVPDDITLLWADDNWGNIRRFPLKNETDRVGGAGVYYHFDYVGDPRDYKWINTIQLEKTAEQLHMAYARQADRIWIVNVGDLKPLEIPISHFLDLAYDADNWDVDSTEHWIKAWIGREFGTDHVDDIASIMIRYGMYAARRKYELVEARIYSVLNYNEAEAVLDQWNTLEDDAQKVYDDLDSEYQPAFFQMILHPAKAGRILHEIYITAATNNLYAWQKRFSANDRIDHARALLYADANLTGEWDEVLDGKWKHMMDQTHLGYDGYWQQPMANTLPQMVFVQDTITSLAGHLRVGIESSNASIPGDDQFHPNTGATLQLPPIDSYGVASRWFDVFSTGTDTCEWTAATDAEWVKLSESSGTVGPEGNDTRVWVTIDWENAPSAPNSTIVPINITTPCRKFEKYAYREPQILLPVNIRSLPDNFTEGFVESDGTISIEGPHYQSIAKPSGGGGSNSSSKISYHTFKNYGRTFAGVGLWPMDLDKIELEEAPALQYELYLYSNDTLANVTLYLSPTQNYLSDLNPLEYAIALYPASDSTPEDPERVRFVGDSEGAGMPPQWGHSVSDAVWGVNSNTSTTGFNTTLEGAYTLKIWCLFPSIIVQKIVIDLGGVRPSYLGPPESFLVGRDEAGEYEMSSFLDTPDTVGAVTLRKKKGGGGGGSQDDDDDAAVMLSHAGGWAVTMAVAVMLAVLM